MSDHLMKNILLIGASPMAIDYWKVLAKLNCQITVIGRGPESAKSFEDITGQNVTTGGLQSYFLNCQETYTHAIVAVGVESLAQTTSILIKQGVNNILVEKPAALTYEELLSLYKIYRDQKSHINIAYNRRFYSSVLKAKKIIEEDAGVTSFHFEFTEWSHKIKDIPKAKGIKENWLIANSSHVIDLAFYLGGKVESISCYTGGKLEWHDPSIFSGAGKADNGALFSYQANWEAPGRWSLEILTKNHRLILKPLESLQLQKIGSVIIEDITLEDDLDKNFKPGIYLQTLAFLENRTSELCSLDDQVNNFKIYHKILGK